MLLRGILGYMPANLVPALIAVATITIFTRLLSPDEFGHYALAQAVVLFGQAAAFYALQVSITRFYERAAAAGALERLLVNAYALYLLCALLAVAIFAAFVVLLDPAPELAGILWPALPTLLARGLVYLNLATHRGAGRIGRYNAVEVGQSLIAFLVALGLVWGLGVGAAGLIWGLFAGALAVLLLDLPLLCRAIGRPDRAGLLELVRFGSPLMGAHGLNAVLLYADRFFIERILGTFAVGLYAAAFAIVERALNLVFMAVTLGAYPLVIKALERDGVAAARAQHARNYVALLALALPAAAGLCLAAPQIAAVLVGEDYREGVVALIPWVAALAFLRGMGAHFLDQTLHLSRRTGLFFYTLGSAVVLVLVLNPLLLPRLGLAGGLVAAIAAQGAALVVTAYLGRRTFGIDWPFTATLRVVLAVLGMALALTALPFPATALGLGLVVATGAAVYAALALALDVAGARAWLLSRRGPFGPALETPP